MKDCLFISKENKKRKNKVVNLHVMQYTCKKKKKFDRVLRIGFCRTPNKDDWYV